MWMQLMLKFNMCVKNLRKRKTCPRYAVVSIAPTKRDTHDRTIAAVVNINSSLPKKHLIHILQIYRYSIIKLVRWRN